MRFKCKFIKPLLSQYADDELNPAKGIFVSGHLKRCPECASEYKQLISAKELVRESQLYIETPPYLRQAILYKIKASAGKPLKRPWTLRPEFSWGIATISVLAMLVGYLVFIKPDVSACNLIATIDAGTGNLPAVSEVSSVLNYFGRTQDNLISSMRLTIQQNDCKGDDSIILHMTVKRDNEILVYTQGNIADIKPAASTGARLKKTSIDGNDFYVGNFIGMKVVCWKRDGESYAMAIRETA
ncbi:MAG: zf-HC2 domain-containing protein [Thermodesulfovibrionales bacterium]|nr:zf-HC2 domain-containing protein [Thermodesulfovibrionales bacterium]